MTFYLCELEVKYFFEKQVVVHAAIQLLIHKKYTKGIAVPALVTPVARVVAEQPALQMSAHPALKGPE